MKILWKVRNNECRMKILWKVRNNEFHMKILWKVRHNEYYMKIPWKLRNNNSHMWKRYKGRNIIRVKWEFCEKRKTALNEYRAKTQSGVVRLLGQAALLNTRDRDQESDKAYARFRPAGRVEKPARKIESRDRKWTLRVGRNRNEEQPGRIVLWCIGACPVLSTIKAA